MNDKNFLKKELLRFFSEFKFSIAFVVFVSLIINFMILYIPRITRNAYNGLVSGTYNESETLTIYFIIATCALVFGILQTFLSANLAEKIAYRLRELIISKVSTQSFQYIQNVTVAKLLTNITNDVDAVKLFISQGIVVVFASLVLLIGSAASLLSINWRLAIPIILIVPILFAAFSIIFTRINKLFLQSSKLIDKLNSTINETVVGAALVRILNSKNNEVKKFDKLNNQSKLIGTNIVNGFASLVPLITFLLNIGTLIILELGGELILYGKMKPGDLQAFFSYLGTFITPVILLGFLSTVFSRAFASYTRIAEVLFAKSDDIRGNIQTEIKGDIELKNVNLNINNKSILKDISFSIKEGGKVAIVGPTAAGKTQLIYLLSSLIRPTTGSVLIDNISVFEYSPEYLYQNLGIVFQDSIIYNTTILENITFNQNSNLEKIDIAIKTANLEDFVSTQELGLKTRITERGTSPSGGQKQRLSLARALAINPKILLLDDFTSRVDFQTEKQILKELYKNYKDLTIISVTQKIEPVKEFDKIILIMEGELLAIGTHLELLNSSLEYKQIYLSQQSTE